MTMKDRKETDKIDKKEIEGSYFLPFDKFSDVP